MIKESDFIIEELKKWDKKFDGIHIRYGYDKPSAYHVIEISPESIRRGDIDYMNTEYKFWERFSKIYPKSDLLISNPNYNTECISENLLYDNYYGRVYN